MSDTAPLFETPARRPTRADAGPEKPAPPAVPPATPILGPRGARGGTWLSRLHLFRRPGFWIALVILALGATFGALRARGPVVRTVAPIRQDLEQHIVASGRVWVPTRMQVSAQMPGLVLAVDVLEGAHVRAGDVLVRMDDATVSAEMVQAKAAVAQASARADQLRRVGAVVANEGLRQAQTNLDHAVTELERSRALASAGAIGQADLDDGQRAVDLARAQKTAALAQQIAAAPKGADSRVALTALLQAEAQLAAVAVRLAQTKIVAPKSGVVLTRTVEPGDVVQPSRTLLVLAADSEGAQIVFQSDERNLASIRIGQKARISADAYPTEVFDAEVSYIAPSIDPERGSVEVRLRAASAPDHLKPDMTVSIDLTVAAKKQALTLPSDVVRGAASPAPWLLAVEGGRVVRADVGLGIRGDGTIEIASELKEGTDVIVPDGQLLTAGQRVRATREER